MNEQSPQVDIDPQTKKEKLNERQFTLWTELGGKLSSVKEALEEEANKLIVANKNDPEKPKFYHGFSHISFARKCGAQIIEILDLEQVGIEDDSPEKQQLQDLVDILLLYHDVILEANDESCVEMQSALKLIEDISQLEVDLTEQEEAAIKTAIMGTVPDFEGFIIKQPNSNESMLAAIVAAADLGHFALGEFDEFLKLSLDLAQEMKFISSEERTKFAQGEAVKSVNKFLETQDKFLSLYQYPELLPGPLGVVLQRKKEARVTELKKRFPELFE